jgi:hypothetical protein
MRLSTNLAEKDHQMPFRSIDQSIQNQMPGAKLPHFEQRLSASLDCFIEILTESNVMFSVRAESVLGTL